MADGSGGGLNGSNGLGHNKGPLGDASPALMHEFLARYDGYLDERKTINKIGKELRKDIEKAGIPLPAWDQFVKLRDEPGIVRERNDAAFRELMRWDLKPIGLQASMDLSPSQGSPELNVHELKRVDNEGYEAGREPKAKRERNPYPPGTEAAQRWDVAWLRGQADIASTLTDDPKKAEAAKAAGEAPKRGRGRPRREAAPPAE